MGAEKPASRQPCPCCGSTARRFEQWLTASVTVRADLSLKAKPPKGKPFMLQRVCAELFRLTGRWHRIHRVIDRRGDRYYERIEDDETGEVVRLVDEPLTDHQGRGSARGKKS